MVLVVHSGKKIRVKPRTEVTLQQTAAYQRSFCLKQYPKLPPQTQLATVNNVKTYVYQHQEGRSDIVSDILLRGMPWEKKETAQILKAMARSPVTSAFDPPLFVDIGANLGWFSLNVAAAGYQVIAIEALPDNLLMLRNSACANDFRDNLNVVPLGLGNANTTCYMFAGTTNMGDGTMLCGYTSTEEALRAVPKTDFKTVGWRYVLRGVTKIRRLDELIFQPIKVLKMDVEGFEPKVLQGAKKLLENQMIANVIMEVNGVMLGRNETLIFEMLSMWLDYGYRVSMKGFDRKFMSISKMRKVAKQTDKNFNLYASLNPWKIKKGGPGLLRMLWYGHW